MPRNLKLMDIFSAIWYAVFVPAAPGGQNYALFPENAAPQELDELFRRLEEGSLTAPRRWTVPCPTA